MLLVTRFVEFRIGQKSQVCSFSNLNKCDFKFLETWFRSAVVVQVVTNLLAWIICVVFKFRTYIIKIQFQSELDTELVWLVKNLLRFSSGWKVLRCIPRLSLSHTNQTYFPPKLKHFPDLKSNLTRSYWRGPTRLQKLADHDWGIFGKIFFFSPEMGGLCYSCASVPKVLNFHVRHTNALYWKTVFT